DCYIPSDDDKQSFPVGVLSLRPAGIPCRIVTKLDAYKVVLFGVTPEKYREINGQDDKWEPGRTPNILGTPMTGTMLRIAQEMVAPGHGSRRLLTLLCESLVIDMARFA